VSAKPEFPVYVDPAVKDMSPDAKVIAVGTFQMKRRKP
jgi:hypothetical protein